MPIIRGKADTSAVIYSDGLRTYDGLVNYGYEKYYRDQYSDTEFAAGHNHMNGIENFWGLCKVCALQSSAEYIDILSLYTSKSENLDTTTETKIFT